MTALAQVWPGNGFRHEAAMYRGERGFLDVTVDYVRDGIAAGEAVVVAVVAPKIQLLRTALGRAARAVSFVDMAEAGRNPARIIPLWRDTVDAAAGTAVRGVGEPVWAGRRAAEQSEALLHESLLNLAFADGPELQLRCPYDADALGSSMVDAAHRRHPDVVDGGGLRCGVGYRNAEDAAREFTVPLDDDGVHWGPDVVRFDDMPAVRKLRGGIAAKGADLGMDADRVADLALAVHEVAVNSLRHGGGSGTVRTWVDDASLVCEVSDRGHIREPLVGRIRPTLSQLSGRGVWLANQLCDLVQLRSSAAGTTVRMHLTR